MSMPLTLYTDNLLSRKEEYGLVLGDRNNKATVLFWVVDVMVSRCVDGDEHESWFVKECGNRGKKTRDNSERRAVRV